MKRNEKKNSQTKELNQNQLFGEMNIIDSYKEMNSHIFTSFDHYKIS